MRDDTLTRLQKRLLLALVLTVIVGAVYLGASDYYTYAGGAHEQEWPALSEAHLSRIAGLFSIEPL